MSDIKYCSQCNRETQQTPYVKFNNSDFHWKCWDCGTKNYFDDINLELLRWAIENLRLKEPLMDQRDYSLLKQMESILKTFGEESHEKSDSRDIEEGE